MDTSYIWDRYQTFARTQCINAVQVPARDISDTVYLKSDSVAPRRTAAAPHRRCAGLRWAFLATDARAAAVATLATGGPEAEVKMEEDGEGVEQTHALFKEGPQASLSQLLEVVHASFKEDGIRTDFSICLVGRQLMHKSR
eukprot:6190737-Pleurochrysis_carterae.AAC.5